MLTFVFALLAVVARAQPNANFSVDIGLAKFYNGFFTNTFYALNGSVAGRLAAGNDAVISLFSIGGGLFGGAQISCPELSNTVNFTLAQYSLVVGDTLIIANTRIQNGGVVFGDNDSVVGVTSFDVGSGCPILQNASAVDFFQEQQTLRTASRSLSELTQTGSYNINGTLLNLNFEGNSSLEVIYINGSDLFNISQVSANNFPQANASILLNVNGRSTGFNSSGMGPLAGFSRYMLWNFYETRDLIARGVDWRGSILAPYATIFNPNAAFFGQVWAASMYSIQPANSSFGMFWEPFQGTLVQ